MTAWVYWKLNLWFLLTWNWTKKQQSYLEFVNKLRVAKAYKSESFIYPFVCRANQGRHSSLKHSFLLYKNDLGSKHKVHFSVNAGWIFKRFHPLNQTIKGSGKVFGESRDPEITQKATGANLVRTSVLHRISGNLAKSLSFANRHLSWNRLFTSKIDLVMQL